MGKHTTYKAGAERNKIFPACRITEQVHDRLQFLLKKLPAKGKERKIIDKDYLPLRAELAKYQSKQLK